MAFFTSPTGRRASISSLLPATASSTAAPNIGAPGEANTVPVYRAAMSESPAPTTLVNDFWLVVGDHENNLDAPTPDDSRPLRAQLTGIGAVKGLNVRILSLEEFMSMKPGEAPPGLAIGILGHGTTSAEGHKIGGKNEIYLTTRLMEQGRNLGAFAQSVWACEVGAAADEVANSAILMDKPYALYDLRGGKQTSSTDVDIAEIRNTVAYYADCKEKGSCPANVEMYLQSQLSMANSARLILPPTDGATGPGTVGHFPGAKGKALNDGVPISDRLKASSVDDAAISRFNFSAPIKLRSLVDTQNLLYQRAFRGDAESVRTLLAQRGVDVNAPSACGLTPIHIAAVDGRVGVINELLQVPGMDINARNPDGNTPLAIACHAGHLEVVSALLNARDTGGNRISLDINARNRLGCTPLYLAANAGHAAIVGELLQAPGIDANAARHGQTALLAACYKGHAGVAKALLQVGEISGDVEEIVLPALLTACRYGHFNTVSAILHASELDSHRDYLCNALVKFSQEFKASNPQNAD